MSRTENALEKASRIRRSPQPVPAGRNGEPAATGAQGARIEHPHLVTSRSTFSPVAEEYKKLKARVMRMTKQEPFRNVLLVTSSVGGEGKSVTAANLALSLARDYDHSVVLIDADTRKPSLHTLLNVKPGIGLADCVADDIDIGSALVKVGNGNLQFVPAGKRHENPVELFSSQRMRTVILEMKSRYPDRYIIIDTPPVLLFAETKMISALADGIIFVVREGLAPLQHIIEALDLLKEEQLLGIVYNDAGPEGVNGTYPYHSYYRHYHSRT
ncbi:MAG: polysaccharide biosynthesis protein [Nitrospirae bacterium GWC2_57_9]|nr:MAG: polysaccharide biosynthesis protein [Nitrospirae bacterium GWC2_57_9]